MGLVDYDSESSGSDIEAPAKPVPKAAPKPSQSSSKKPFQKVVDRSNPGRILVNLPQLSAEAPKTQGDEPPAKRARTGGTGRFSGFNSFLPPPKNANKPKPPPATSSAGPAVHFKTSAAPGFSRNAGDERDSESSTGMSLPPPKASAQPSIPDGLKPEEDVKLVGKPLMFKPLSVARTQKKKKKPVVAKAAAQNALPQTHAATEMKADAEPAPAPKKGSLFSMHTEEPSEPVDPTQKSAIYTPMFETQETMNPYDNGAYGDYAQYASQAQTGPSATTAPGSESLDTIVNDMGLSAAARRELFGRGGEGKHMTQNVINFNMDKEYEHNEEIRAAGDQQTHNPVRAIQGGKHSLRQLVQNVHNQKEALEDSFAKGRTNRKEASNKYGW
ncbi:mitotic checkpoint regulator, MAD2B-interacting-domain-containing protein [Dactylonectria estremocensis]|uniref:Mitotic checkpoint regulator, MAD2B-interacting-domain-containing protein n=1 Tax=Dactylonectria estremocensis TaxID=1079267 RepID=A0A9P9FDX0_9HYPO|nr:mitotic checkpoint regulator, MAD2B-interacting-domain-containing protein [Dactylonectria estremocensis]